MKKFIFSFLILSAIYMQAQTDIVYACNNKRGKQVACNDTSIKEQPPYIFKITMKNGEVIKSHECYKIDEITINMVTYSWSNNQMQRTDKVELLNNVAEIAYIKQ